MQIRRRGRGVGQSIKVDPNQRNAETISHLMNCKNDLSFHLVRLSQPMYLINLYIPVTAIGGGLCGNGVWWWIEQLGLGLLSR
ncbi:hypothetical protein U1Q18_015224 [Sarracenia purpurea var. burkii]